MEINLENLKKRISVDQFLESIIDYLGIKRNLQSSDDPGSTHQI
jgi:hypothetical protein